MSSDPDASALKGKNDPAWRLGILRDMLRIRRIEEAISRRYSEQEMRCPVHLSIGQEATAVGACAALKQTDQIVSSHRCHSHYLAKGGDLNAMMAEIYGKETGCCGGRGGSMHLMDTSAGIVASVPIVSSYVPLGIGVALAFQQRDEPHVCLVFLGDGAVEEGVFHESANLAALFKLPVVFVCENNLYSVYTPLGDRQPDRPLVDLARSYDMPGSQVDGNDALAVYDAVDAAVRRAREGDGPTFIVADTYRWLEHCGPDYDNDIGYRSAKEFEAWKHKCPVENMTRQLTDDGLYDAAAEAVFHKDLEIEIDRAFEFAKNSPEPDPATVGDHVYA